MSLYEVSLELNIPIKRIKQIEEQFRQQVFSSLSTDIEQDRALRISQLDQVIRDARAIAQASYEYTEKLKALDTITRAIVAAAKLTGLEQNGNGANVTNNTLIVSQIMEAKKLLGGR